MTAWVIALLAAAVLTPAIDQGVKFALRRTRGHGMRLAALGSVHITAGRLWLNRCGSNLLWLWLIAAVALIAGSAMIPSSGVFAGLMVGGSLSNAVESSRRGAVTDYVCLRFWPAFNLSDVALTVGAVGMAGALLVAIAHRPL